MRDLLLLHGAGGTPEMWDSFRTELPDFHCVAPDLNGLTTWEAMLDHLEGLNLDNPAVVGVSLGGALGVKWAQRHPDCPGLVNLDGNGWPASYPGLSESEVAEWKAKLTTLFDEMAKDMPAHHVALRPLIDNGTVHELYDGLTTPAMAVVAMQLMPPQEPFAEFYIAFRHGVLADLAELDGVRVVEFHADHGMLSTNPAELAKLAGQFLVAG